MAFEIVGRLHKKFETQQVTDKFQKREFVLEIEDGAYPQVIKFQLTQANCGKLDPVNEGDQIKVTFNLKGREYNKDGKTMYFTNLDAWRIDNANTGQTVAPATGSGAFPNATDEPSITTDMEDLPF